MTQKRATFKFSSLLPMEKLPYANALAIKLFLQKRASRRKVETIPEGLADFNRGPGNCNHCQRLSNGLLMSTSPKVNSNEN